MSYPPPPGQYPEYPQQHHQPAYGYPAPPPPRRGGNRGLVVVLAVLIGLILVGTAVTVPFIVSRDDDGSDDTAQGADGGDEGDDPSVDTSNLDAVREYGGLEPEHVEGEVDYDQSPPVGGSHNPSWLECGVYDEPVADEYVVHDLEHGTVWITYLPEEVDDAGLAALEEVLPDNGIMSPYPDQAAPVVMTVWGAQLELTGPDDPRIQLFLDAYGDSQTAPEPYASCAGGLTGSEGATVA